MNNLKHVTGGAIKHATAWSDDGMLAAGYKPLMWLMALLLAAVVAGCGGSSGSSPVPLNNPPPPGGLAAVDLMTAGDFAIVAGASITCSGSCVTATSAVPSVTGDVATSGVATTFPNYAMDTSNDFAIASGVVSGVTATGVATLGRIYEAGDTGSGGTPAKVSKAATDMVTAYNDAINRPAGTGAFLDAGVLDSTLTIRDIGGKTLLPGVYTWTAPTTADGNVTIATDVTLTGSATDVWIFQIPGYLTQAATAHVLLTGSALAKNIFWQVGNYVELGASPAHFEGVILSKKYITTGAGTTVTGRLLSQTAVTLAGAVTAP